MDKIVKQEWAGTPRNLRTAGETFKRFTQCLKWAKEGKTFMYVHPDFVAIDIKTWNKLKREKRIPRVYYDEYQDWTPEMEARLEKYLSARVVGSQNLTHNREGLSN